MMRICHRPLIDPLSTPYYRGLGAFSGCAVFENGQMHCWDYNDEPKPAPDFEGVERISMDSQTRGCALLRGGRVRCWDIDISDNKEISIPE